MCGGVQNSTTERAKCVPRIVHILDISHRSQCAEALKIQQVREQNVFHGLCMLLASSCRSQCTEARKIQQVREQDRVPRIVYATQYFTYKLVCGGA